VGEKFDLLISVRWPNTFTRSRENDYMFFPLGYEYQRGIDRYVIRLISDVPIIEYQLERLAEGNLIKERSQPKVVEKTRDHITLEWETTQPQWIYMLRFRKQLPREG